jgi:CheY-like chemotaxis protein
MKVRVIVRVSVALILVVDDEFGVAEVLEAILADVGHEVVTAANGRQALERAKERLPDLVLLDFMMPIMDGPSVLKAMREAPALRNIPAVILSSLPENAISKSVGGMYAAFVRKPFRINTVVDTVNVVLGQQR